MDHPLPGDRLPDLVAKATDPHLSLDRKLAVARGVLPMSMEDLMLSLYQLSHDEEVGISRLSRQTAQGLPPEMLKGALRKMDLPEPLDFFAGEFSARASLMEIILLNKATADETVEKVARTCIRNVADLVAANQQRLLRHPAIIEALYLNKNTRMSTVDMVVSFAVRQGLVLDGIPAFREIAAAIGADPGPTAATTASPNRHRLDMMFDDISTALDMTDSSDDSWGSDVMSAGIAGMIGEDDSFFGEFDDGEGDVTEDVYDEFDGDGGYGQAEDIFGEFDHDPMKARERGEEEEQGELALSFQLAKLSVPQKIRLALLGTVSHRALLITDSNKLVSMAVIKSPTMTDQEVMRYTTSRNISEDILRFIAGKREWTRNYFVKVNLINNPKTPLPSAMQFLTHLRRNDLRSLIGNKNVPTALTTAAKNMLKRIEKK